MKIAIICRAVYPFHGYGGMQKYVFNLAKNLAKQNVDVEIITSSIGNNKIETKKHDGIKYVFLKQKTGAAFEQDAINYRQEFSFKHFARTRIPKWILTPVRLIPAVGFLFYETYKYHKFNLQVRDYLKKNNFDIIYGTGLSTLDYLREKKRNPVIVQAFGNECFHVKSIEEKIGLIFFRRMLFKCMEKGDLIASEGEKQTEEIIHLFKVKKDKIFLLPDGVNLEEINNSKIKIKRNDLGIDDKDLVLITVNRLVPLKGVIFIVKALKNVVKKVPNAKLIIIGVGIEETNIYQLIKKEKLENNVIHLKNIKDNELYNYLKLSDIYINHSLHPVLLISVLEAMACKLPIITTNTQENTVINGKNGYIIPIYDSDAVAKAVLKLYIDKDTRKMGEQSFLMVRKYDWNKIVNNFIKNVL